MCFYKSRFARVKVATEDIEVIKVIVRHYDNKYKSKEILSPYLGVRLGKKVIGLFTHRFWTNKIYHGVHSYSTEHSRTIKKDGNFFYIWESHSKCFPKLDYKHNVEVTVEAVRAIIPQGTRYYVAKQPDGTTQYVSEKLLLDTNHIITLITKYDVELY